MSRFRAGRFRLFVDSLGLANAPKGSLRILDIGGTLNYWTTFEPLLPDSVGEVVIINLDQPEEKAGRFTMTQGDGTALAYPDKTFDAVHSNSVIEHVGHWREMQAMAREIRRVAPRHFIQTPNLWFPYEPHYRAPFFQFLPEDTRANLVSRKRRGWVPQAADYADAMATVQTINLLSARQMRALFPHSRLYREKFLGLTKSLVAIGVE